MKNMNIIAREMYDFCEYLNTDFSDEERNNKILEMSADSEDPADFVWNVHLTLLFYELAQLQPKGKRHSFFKQLVVDALSGDCKLVIVDQRNDPSMRGGF